MSIHYGQIVSVLSEACSASVVQTTLAALLVQASVQEAAGAGTKPRRAGSRDWLYDTGVSDLRKWADGLVLTKPSIP